MRVIVRDQFKARLSDSQLIVSPLQNRYINEELELQKEQENLSAVNKQIEDHLRDIEICQQEVDKIQ